MLIDATHTSDGRRLDPATEASAPFVAWLDEPAATDITVGSPLLRCRGWAMARDGSEVRVKAQLHDGTLTTREGVADLPRPDVAANLAADFGSRAANCGFDLLVPLPDKEEPVDVVVRFDDGAHAGQIELRVRRGTPTARGDYKSTWEPVSTDAPSAAMAVAGYSDEGELQRTAGLTVRTLQGTVGLSADDVVLEIGAGIGRVGPSIAPLVRRWIATDVSSNMLKHARERCAGFDNIEYVELNGWDLAPIADSSVDVVYCTVVFMHLDEWERFSYIREAMRVLRPGGRVFVDNVNLRSDEGWEFFTNTMRDYHPLVRPPNVSKTSTAEELTEYLRRAGFVDIRCNDEPVWLWVSAWAKKPA